MITIQELMLIKEAVSTTALEKGWDKQKEEEMFHEAVLAMIKEQTRVSKKKRHRQ